MILTAYRLITDAAAWPLRVMLRWRAICGKEDLLRLPERQGISSQPRPRGTVIWCHAASVGESIALLPLIDRLLLTPNTYVVLTTGTLTSAQIMADRLPQKAVHQFAPWDRWTWIQRFLDHWQPSLAIRMESEIWPNTILALKQRTVPSAVVNARLSAESLRGWARFPDTARRLFSSIDCVIAQSETFASAFQQLGAQTVTVAPNLKLAADPLPVDDSALTSLQDRIGERPVWLAASTHDGEEAIALAVHRHVSETVPNLLTIIAPRHPDRGGHIMQLICGEGFKAARRDSSEPLTAETEIYLADTLGELGLFYQLAPVVFMGKSLTAVGGQNPIEAAHFGCAILFGMHMENFEDIAETMIAEGLAQQVTDGRALAESVTALLSDDAHRSVISKLGRGFVNTGKQSLEQTATALESLVREGIKHGL